jgi:hypothetical protein
VLLGRALGYLEAIFGVEAVTRVRGATDFAAVLAMAENLLRVCQPCTSIRVQIREELRWLHCRP